MDQSIINLLSNIKLNNSVLKNANPNLMQRGIADLLEKYIVEEIKNKSPKNVLVSVPKSKRSIEDILLQYNNNNYYIDVKTINDDGKFNMPNLISIDRLRKLYKSDRNYFVLICVHYANKQIINIEIHQIEKISFESIHIQNLGKGQLQLKNSQRNICKFNGTRSEWLRQLRENAIIFYDNLISKTKKLRESWN